MDLDKQPLSKDEKHSIYISIFLGVLGYVIALFTYPDVFARFGALIVCIGVYFGAKGFTLTSSKIAPIADKMMEEKIRKGLEYLDTKKTEFSEQLVEENKLKFLEKSKELKSKRNRSIYALEMRVVRVESWIIMAGTLIWAFGDYLVLETFTSFVNC